MSNYTITCSNLLLNNPYGSESVTIKNKRHNDPIKFGSKVEFEQSVEYQSLKIGNFLLTVDETGDKLQIKKNNTVLFEFQE
jgi:hypothetical protein